MRARFAPLALIAAVVLAFGVVASACDSDGALSIEEYFQEVDALIDDVAEQSNALGEEVFVELDPSAPFAEQIEAVRAFNSGFQAITEGFVDSLNDLDPPAEVEVGHTAFVEAADDFVEASEDFVDQLDEVESEAELEALFAAFDEAGDPEQACLDLQDIADENEIDVSLNCGLE